MSSAPMKPTTYEAKVISRYFRKLQQRGAAKRWQGLSAEQRSAVMRRVRAAGLKKKQGNGEA